MESRNGCQDVEHVSTGGVGERSQNVALTRAKDTHNTNLSDGTDRTQLRRGSREQEVPRHVGVLLLEQHADEVLASGHKVSTDGVVSRLGNLSRRQDAISENDHTASRHNERHGGQDQLAVAEQSASLPREPRQTRPWGG